MKSSRNTPNTQFQVRETPLTVYLATNVHAKTGKKQIVDTLNYYGLSVSYDRLLRISTSLCNAASKRYAKEKVVCPQNLRLGLFTTGAYDNIDHNPSSTTSTDSFHGTSMSLFQHVLPHSQGEERHYNVDYVKLQDRSAPQLPETYAQVLPSFLPQKQPLLPKLLSSNITKFDIYNNLQLEFAWLQNTIYTY